VGAKLHCRAARRGFRALEQSVSIERSGRRVGQARIRSIAEELLSASTLCAISTVGPRGRAYVNTAYFAWSQDFRIVWLSEPSAQHSRNLRANGSVAIAVYDSSQTWGREDRGIQICGEAHAGGPDAEEIYTRRFSAYGEAELDYRFYELVPRSLKLFDERALGRATFVTARVGDGRLAWERTEIYRT
jgi:uncharacterized protein YhbP (UPF0306 family)